MKQQLTQQVYLYLVQYTHYIDTEVETVSVPAKSLSSEQLTVTESGSRLFGILISVVVPVIILLAGIVVWVRRRKR